VFDDGAGLIRRQQTLGDPAVEHVRQSCRAPRSTDNVRVITRQGGERRRWERRGRERRRVAVTSAALYGKHDRHDDSDEYEWTEQHHGTLLLCRSLSCFQPPPERVGVAGSEVLNPPPTMTT
jgi:hypothetical protein